MNRDFPNSDEFIYRGWLRGSTSVERKGNHCAFKPVYAREYYCTPVLQCCGVRTPWSDPQRTRMERGIHAKTPVSLKINSEISQSRRLYRGEGERSAHAA